MHLSFPTPIIGTDSVDTVCMYSRAMYVCMVITDSKGKDQPGKVANPARGQLNRGNELLEEMNYFLSPFAPENLVSRDGFGCPVPRQPAHLHTPAESGAYLRNSSRVPRRRSSSCLDSFYSSKGNISHCCSPRYGFRKKQARGTFCWPTRPSIQLVQR